MLGLRNTWDLLPPKVTEFNRRVFSDASMRRARYFLLLGACCLPFATHADTEWILAGGKNDGTYRIYVGSNIKRLPNGLVEGWEVWDYREPQTDIELKITYRSRVWLQSFNCKERSAAPLSLAFYADSMGKGMMMHSIKRSQDKIKYLRPASGSPGEYMVNKVCSWVK